MKAKDLSLDYARKLDHDDVLQRYRHQFYIKQDTYYLDGNSLGVCSSQAEQSLLNALQSWKDYGIDGWMDGNEPWFYYAEKLGRMTAPLIGAEWNEVIVTGSTTVNLHQLISTFYKPNGKRTKILADALTFPSDIYAIKSQLALHHSNPDKHLILVQSEDGITLKEDDIIEHMSEEVALIILPSVLYRSGQLLDMEKLTTHANNKGIMIGFDLAHSIGAIPHKLTEIGVDFAFWCNYKYLNAGPGSVGGLYVNQKHDHVIPGLNGWFGSNKEKQFDMDLNFEPAADAGAFQIGTPHLFSMAPLLGSLKLFEEVGIEAIRHKSLQLTDYMMMLIDELLSGDEINIINPREADRRGGHVCLQHEEAIRISKALKAEQVIPDFRAPNMIRLAPIAFYTSFEDVWHSMTILKEIIKEKKYEAFEKNRNIIA